MLHVFVGMSSSQFTPISPGMPIPLARQWAWHTERKKPGFAGSTGGLPTRVCDRAGLSFADRLSGVALAVVRGRQCLCRQFSTWLVVLDVREQVREQHW